MTLRNRLATNGFESNDDFEFPLKCLLEANLDHLRCLHIAGNSGRRKTAFANALAAALEYPRILYLDLSQAQSNDSAIANVTLGMEGSDHSNEPALSAFERIITEACAFSEAEPTILIFDQLHAADFRDQSRLYQFVASGIWSLVAGQVKGSEKNLLLVLISDQELYHSLAHVSFRIWADPVGGKFDYKPGEFGLGMDACDMFEKFAHLFNAIESVPTPSEFRRVLDDSFSRVRTEEQLRQSIFGWMELADRNKLNAAAYSPLILACVNAINEYVGLDHIELNESEPRQHHN